MPASLLQEIHHGPNNEGYFSEESLHQEDLTRLSRYSAGKIKARKKTRQLMQVHAVYLQVRHA